VASRKMSEPLSTTSLVIFPVHRRRVELRPPVTLGQSIIWPVRRDQRECDATARFDLRRVCL
jgi:hypothetical protein